MIRKVMFYTRRGIKIIILSVLATFLIIGTITFLYKPTYSVYLNNEKIGYTENKSKLQKKINDYAKNGDGKKENLAFVQLKETPKYKLCLLKKNEYKNDDEIFDKVKQDEVFYYRYYAILDGEEEKLYMNDFTQAEEVIKELKGKKSKNKENITIKEKYDTEEKEFTEKSEAVAKLYKEPDRNIKVASSRSANRSKSEYSKGSSFNSVNLGISLIRPTTGVITSRYGYRHGRLHTGLDIANGYGTNIVAAASGKVTLVKKDRHSFGNCVKISHGNGVETLYAHCSKINVSVGQNVFQGQSIAAMGSTGNSTGPHLHFEVRKNGTTYNPQNFVY